MSNVLQTYLMYMSNWADESDEHIQDVIDEYKLFVQLEDFDSDKAVNQEFHTLVKLAEEVRDSTIAADALQISADAAAASAIWTFGFGMAAFATAEAGAVIASQVASAKSKKLNKKMGKIDTDISKLIGPSCDNWVKKYKLNNDMIAAKKNSAIDGAHARAILLKFIAAVVRKEGDITPERFRVYANSCKVVLKDEKAIGRVYDALDTINLSGANASDDEIAEVVDQLKNLATIPEALFIVRSVCVGYMTVSLLIVHQRIKTMAAKKGLEVEELETSALKEMQAMEKISVVIGCMVSVIDTVFQIYDIVKVTEQTKKMVHELNGPIKKNYLTFFNGIRDSAKAYVAALKEKDEN